MLMDKPFPLDYIMSVPKHLKNKNVDPAIQRKALALENILKNVVVRRLTEIRIINAKPSIKESVKEYMD